MKKVTLNVSGITCQGCANSVKAAVSRVAGVRRVDVSVEQKQARVVLEEAGWVDDLVSAVREAGYEASVPTQGE